MAHWLASCLAATPSRMTVITPTVTPTVAA
jgi:hypothetical protein